MSTWAEFANAAPDLAAFGLERMNGRIVYQATLRLDGSPRVHPVSPWIAAGLLCVSFRATSPKRREVARDARYALHTAQPWEDHMGEHGEFMARGWLEQISPSHPAVTARPGTTPRSEEHTSELQSHSDLVCRLLLEKKKTKQTTLHVLR